MNWLYLNYLTAMRNSLAEEARCCPGDFDKQDILYSEARLYERRINAEWRHYAAYDGGGAIPARYRNARENQRGEWRAL